MLRSYTICITDMHREVILHFIKSNCNNIFCVGLEEGYFAAIRYMYVYTYFVFVKILFLLCSHLLRLTKISLQRLVMHIHYRSE